MNKSMKKKFSCWQALNPLLWRFGLLVLIGFLMSCSNDNKDLLNKFEEINARKGRPIEPIPEVKFVPKFIYPSYLKRRNPFVKFTKVSKVSLDKAKPDVNAPDMTRKKDALEYFKLRDLVMVGILQGEGDIWGLVSTAEEQIFKVRVGDYMGQDFGKVVKITNEKINIVEKYKKKNVWHKRNAVLALDVTQKNIMDHKQIKFKEILR